jgi:serine/threonine protein kinase/tetratricopeptide (TPR) repeat protein
MSSRDRLVEETLPAGEQAAEKRAAEEPTRSSAVARPQRYGLASRMEKAKAMAALFAEPVEEVRVGRFVLREYVGGGGMGEVYAAWDEKARRKVALKMVRADHAVAAQPNDRLLREAQVLAQLADPNVVHLYEVDEIDGRVFLAMELVRGRSLRRWLQDLDDPQGGTREHGQARDELEGPARKLEAPKGRARVREVLRQFVAAGRGLKAAHAAGLVHRDFKPDNVLVGDDGRVRVVDFGLARTVTDLVPAAAPDRFEPAGARWLADETQTLDGPDGRRPPQHWRPGRAMTTHGKIMGTLSYMSPEQLRGVEADHRSDQFSFCVALYEALYQQTPFSGSSFVKRLQSIERGAAEPPRGSAVPAALRKAILRGLAADPAARFPDMASLLDVLEGWLQPRRRSQAVAMVVALVIIGGIILAVVVPKDPCRDAGTEVAALWTPARRDAIRKAFVGTGLSYAAASWSTLEHGLGRYVEQLEGEVVATCEATHPDPGQTNDLSALRKLCLHSRQRRLGALIEQLEHADASMVERAHAAAAELPDLAVCEHPETLLHGMKPAAPELAPQVDEIRDHLADARTQELLGKRDEALRTAREQLERAQTASYGPVQAEALYQTGRVLAYDGKPEERDEGEGMLRQAAKLAESERHDELVAEIWNFLVFSANYSHSGTEQARQWQERADTAIRRIGDPPRYRADALRNLARVYLKEGKLAEAETEQRKVLAALESAPEISRLDRLVYQLDLAGIVRRRGRYQEAQELYERALALHIEELGETHPLVANVRYGLAMVHKDRGASAVARQLLDDLLRVHGETLGATHVLLGHTHGTLAELNLFEGSLARAREHAMQSLDIYERAYGAGHARLADLYARLGGIELRRGAHDKALTAYETALDINTRHLGASHVNVGYGHLNIAEARLALGQYAEALAAVERAEAILQPSLADSPLLAPFLASVRGRAHLGKGELEAAVAALERAVQGLAAGPGDAMPMERADAGWALALSLSKLGRADDPRALALARDALAIYERQGAEVHTPRQAVRRWIDAHDRP